MKKQTRAFLIMVTFILLCIDIFYIVQTFLFYTFNESIKFAGIVIIPLLLLLLIYFINNRLTSDKIVINIGFLVCSLVSFIFSLIYYICYLLLIIKKPSVIPFLLSSLLFVIFIILSFKKNFKINAEFIIIYFVVLFTILLFAQFVFISVASFFSSSDSVFNINRYEYVKYYYFSPEEVSELPDKIPPDATNIVFYFDIDTLGGTCRELKLEYDSETIANDTHHAEYYIHIDN